MAGVEKRDIHNIYVVDSAIARVSLHLQNRNL